MWNLATVHMCFLLFVTYSTSKRVVILVIAV